LLKDNNNQYANFAVFVVFQVEIAMKKCYISQTTGSKKYPVTAHCHYNGLGRVGFKKNKPASNSASAH